MVLGQLSALQFICTEEVQKMVTAMIECISYVLEVEKERRI